MLVPNQKFSQHSCDTLFPKHKDVQNECKATKCSVANIHRHFTLIGIKNGCNFFIDGQFETNSSLKLSSSLIVGNTD